MNDDRLLYEFNQLLEEKEKLCRCEIMEWSEFPIGVTGKTLKRVFRNRGEQFCTDFMWENDRPEIALLS